MQEKKWLKPDNEDSLITIDVKTMQKEDKFEFEDGMLVIKISDLPRKGKANKKLLKMLRKIFHTEIVLETGHKSSRKVFRLKNISTIRVLELLQN